MVPGQDRALVGRPPVRRGQVGERVGNPAAAAEFGDGECGVDLVQPEHLPHQVPRVDAADGVAADVRQHAVAELVSVKSVSRTSGSSSARSCSAARAASGVGQATTPHGPTVDGHHRFVCPLRTAA